jgi:uncharacterized protein (TIGR03437 family)
MGNSSLNFGMSTVSPYTVSSSTIPAGVYSVTAVARDNQGRTTTSSPVQVKISKALKAVRNTRKNASGIDSSANSGTNAAQANKIDTIVTELEQTYLDFHSERGMFESEKQIDSYLFASMFLARSSASLAKQASLNSAVNDRMDKLDAYLGFVEDLMAAGAISDVSLSAASQVNAKVDLVMSQPISDPLMWTATREAGITAIAGAPFATDTFNVGNAGTIYELANVSVSIQGKAAQMLYVSPTLLTFNVPSDVTPGLASVVVTSRDGFISHSVVSISGLNPTIFLNGANTSQGAILNALGIYGGPFSIVTPAQFFGLDARTRLSILATGISTGLSNTNSSNDVWLPNGQMLANLAESVAVEARKNDGTTILLPVEYAGAQGGLSGLDQVNVILPNGLAGAGSVQLTVVINGVRSNTITVVVQ